MAESGNKAMIAAKQRSKLTLSVIGEAADLSRIVPDWLKLLESSRINEVTLTPAWLLTWWQVFGSLDGRRLRVGAIYEDGELVGLAPWLLRRHVYRGGLPFNRIEPLGTGEHERDEVCSDYTNVIVRTGFEEAAGAVLAAGLEDGSLGEWDELVLPLAAGDDPLLGCLIRELDRRGLRTAMEQVSSAPYVPLPGSWDEYLKLLGSSNRYSLKRTLKDFERWAGGNYEVRQASSETGLEEGKRVLVQLHQHRWESAGRDGAFSSTLFMQFHDSLLPKLLDQKSLQLKWLVVEGQPIAALYDILYNGKIYAYQSGRKLGLPKEIRPGTVLHALAIKQAIAEGRREYDFLAGSSQYKRKLSLASRPLVKLRVARRSVREYARAFAEEGIARTRGARRLIRNLSSSGSFSRRVAG